MPAAACAVVAAALTAAMVPPRPVARGISLGDARTADLSMAALAQAGMVERRDLLPHDADLPTIGRRLVTFAQLSDIHLVDEGSPLRTEFLDPWMGTAYRPQEGLTPHVLTAMTAAIAAARSPVSGARAAFTITTGDNTDTGQLNEVRWFIDILDGGVIDPDSGMRGTCGTDVAGPRTRAWPGDGRGYDPDGTADGPGYAADADDNLERVGRANHLADHPDLGRRMNEPFVAPGVGMPWYASFGNHDALVQGNAPITRGLAAFAAGCVKVLDLPATELRVAVDAAGTGGRDAMLEVAFRAMTALASDPAGSPALVRSVPADAARIPVSKRQFIAEHGRTGGTPVGHGFQEPNRRTGDGWYAFRPVPGILMLALDTVNERGGHQGNLDGAQMAWLHQVLSASDAAGEVAIAFGHHSLATMVQPGPGVHLGGAELPVEACPESLSAPPPRLGEPVRCLLLRHPSLIALVDGHEHRHHIAAHARPPSWEVPGGFWEITTASHIEWPQQARLLEVIVADGHIAIVTAIVDHASASTPTGAVPTAVRDLAAIAHDLSHEDPQARNGSDGTSDPSGTAADRAAVLWLPAVMRRLTGHQVPQ